jgi:predicted AlkP superfamily phosphohydrolase/phosphomutase
MAHPERAFGILREAVGEYDLCPLSIQAPHGDPKAVQRHAELPVVATRALLNAFPCDVYMVSFQVLDWVHHGALGREMKPGDVGSLAPDGSVVQACQLVDERVGELLAEWVADDTTVIVISDHGGTSADRLVNLEKLFLDRGLMAYMPLGADGSPVGEQRARARRALRLWTSLKNLAPTVARSLGPLARRLRGRMAGYQSRLAIDWSRTRAVPWGEFAQVRLNLAGRDPRGVVANEDAEALADEVTDILSSLRDPESGRPIYESVLRNAQLYQGPFASAGPDLYAVPRDLRYLSVSARLGAGGLPMLDLQPDPIVCLDPPWGRHAPVGILFMAGPPIQPGVEIAYAALADFAPTALYLLGEPVPDDMDGRVVSEAFRPGILSRRPVQMREPWPEPVRPDAGQSYSAEEQAEIERRLRGLGYL